MWNCPACQSSVEDVFEVCWNCGTSRTGEADPSFVRADDAGPIPDAEPVPTEAPLAPGGELAIAYRARDLMEAQFLAGQLTEAGFPAKADEQDLHESLGGPASPKVYVHEGDLAGARAWLLDYDRNRGVTTDSDDSAEEPSPLDPLRGIGPSDLLL